MSTLSDSELRDIVQRVVQRTTGGDQPAPAAKTSAAAPPVTSSSLESDQNTGKTGRKIALGADHGGFSLKETLKAHLEEQGYQVDDCGTYDTESVDYPDFALAVALKVSSGEAWRGIMIDGAGIGSCMAANKVPGVRAALCYDHATAVNSREHNAANMLTLGAGLIGSQLAQQITLTWLQTDFAAGRHTRRVSKIMKIEQDRK
ncbi:MAG: ribose 5-phosphate isomerase B [Chloroflexi bacterium]|nr:ribose 5-phosphate isomerase B [Chloroflexota bacterium]